MTCSARPISGLSFCKRDAGEDCARGRISVMTGLSAMAFRRGGFAQAQHWDEEALRERLAHEGSRRPDIALDMMNLANIAISRITSPKAKT